MTLKLLRTFETTATDDAAQRILSETVARYVALSCVPKVVLIRVEVWEETEDSSGASA